MRLSFLGLLVVLLLYSGGALAKRSSGKAKKSAAAVLEEDHFEDIDARSAPAAKAMGESKRKAATKGAEKPSRGGEMGDKSRVKAATAASDVVLSRFEEVSAKMPFTWLTDRNFTRYIVDRPRDYHAVVMFTATAKQYKCAVCMNIKAAFVAGAKAFQEEVDFNTDSPAPGQDALARLEAANKRVAFFIMEVENSRQTFEDMGMQTVPRVYVLPPTRDGSPKMRITDFEVPVEALVSGPASFMTAVSAMSHVKVEPRVPPGPAIIGMAAVAYLLALLAAHAAEDPWKAITQWYRSPSLWAFVSTACFCVGVSGSIFCIIRTPPWYGAGKHGEGVQIFAGQGRDQYVLEGLLVAAMSIVCGAAGVLLVRASEWKAPAFVRHATVLAGLALFVTIGMELTETYIFKTGWYSLKETLPSDVWDLFKGSVKKSSTMGRRLFRVSEIWLFEYKDWASFTKKCRTILLDHLFRRQS